MLERLTNPEDLNIKDLTLEQEISPTHFDPRKELGEDDWGRFDASYEEVKTYNVNNTVMWNRIPRHLEIYRVLGRPVTPSAEDMDKINWYIDNLRGSATKEGDSGTAYRNANALAHYYLQLKNLNLPYEISTEDRVTFQVAGGLKAEYYSANDRLNVISTLKKLGLEFDYTDEDREQIRQTLNVEHGQTTKDFRGQFLIKIVASNVGVELTEAEQDELREYLDTASNDNPPFFTWTMCDLYKSGHPLPISEDAWQRMRDAVRQGLEGNKNSVEDVFGWAKHLVELDRLVKEQTFDPSDTPPLPEERSF